jgi:predicted CoA-binding protein
LSEEIVKEVLAKYRTVAVVGLSRDPSKPSYYVPEYLKEHGFRVIPVNPFVDEILGEKSYKSLLDIPVEAQKTVEIVQIFRPSGDVRSIVEQTVQLKRKHAVLFVVWMQLGIVSEQAAEIARSAGLLVVMDRCMMMEHERLFGG